LELKNSDIDSEKEIRRSGIQEGGYQNIRVPERIKKRMTDPDVLIS